MYTKYMSIPQILWSSMYMCMYYTILHSVLCIMSVPMGVGWDEYHQRKLLVKCVLQHNVSINHSALLLDSDVL